jgi:Fe-S-cluster containining protein
MGINDTEYARDWLGYHNIKILQESGAAVMALQIPADCKFLNLDGTCSIYTNPNRPKICADFPVGKDPECPQNEKRGSLVDRTVIPGKTNEKHSNN